MGGYKWKNYLKELKKSQDGGDAELISFKDGVVEIRLQGACGGCPMAMLTLVGFVEKQLKSKVPEVKEVVSV